MTRITIKGMTEKEVAEAMANDTEADYLAEQEAEVLEFSEGTLKGARTFIGHDGDVYVLDAWKSHCYGYPVYTRIEDIYGAFD